MTVVNAMKFNEKEGGMVADAQSSRANRKYDIAEKIYPIAGKENLMALIGGAGISDIVYESIQRLRNHLNQEKFKRYNQDIEGIVRLLVDECQGMKRERIDVNLRSTFSVDTAEVLSGRAEINGRAITIDPQYRAHMMEILTGNERAIKELFDVGYLILGSDAQGVGLYLVDFSSGTHFLSSRPYATIGSGSDASDRVLADFVLGLEREQRKNIEPVRGMEALIRATNASSDYNQGVGGVFTISYIKNGQTLILQEDASKLAAEVVRIGDAKLIPPERVWESLKQLLYEGGDFTVVEANVFNTADLDNGKIIRHLRGYKS